jgi:hypothetical protein
VRGTKNQQKRETKESMKTNTSPVQVLSLPFVAVLLLLQPLGAIADGQVPFRGFWNTRHTDTIDFDPSVGPVIRVEVTGTGKCSHLGAAECQSTDQVAVLATGGITATYTYTAANGDTLLLTAESQTVALDPIVGRISFEGTFEVLGGTGRFAGASGRGTLIGWALFNQPFGSPQNDGPGFFAFDGWLSTVGTLKK